MAIDEKLNNTGKRAAIYARISTTIQAGGESFAEHRLNKLRYACKQNGFKITNIYLDIGAERRKENYLPELGKLLNDAKDNKFNIVILNNMSEISTDFGKSIDVYMKLKQNNVSLGMVSVDGEVVMIEISNIKT